MNFGLTLLFLLAWHPADGVLRPAWSPDHQILATARASERFVTPEGANYTLLLNGRIVYPQPKKSHWFAAYTDQHTFLTDLEWSPDGQHLAFLEKVYDWEYSDPYNRDFEGSVSKKRYYLVIVSRSGKAAGYAVNRASIKPRIDWQGNWQVALDGRIFDLKANPPGTTN